MWLYAYFNLPVPQLHRDKLSYYFNNDIENPDITIVSDIQSNKFKTTKHPVYFFKELIIYSSIYIG